jgi:bla regulator protein blaR1
MRTRIVCRFTLIFLLVCESLIAGSIQGKAQSPNPSGQAPVADRKIEFEVASVRPSAPDTPLMGSQFLLGVDGQAPQGNLFSTNAPLPQYIMFAYHIADISQYKAVNAQLPQWAQTDNFDIEARSPEKSTIDQLRLMMQALLKERFGLLVHVEHQQLQGYALVLDKPGVLGPQLRPHPSDAPCLDRPSEPATVAPGTSPPAYCGGNAWRVNGQLHIRMVDATMGEIVTFLGGAAGTIGGLEGRPVFDRTGLGGRFDLDLQFLMDKAGPAEADANLETDASGPTFTNALNKQLGLKLVKQVGDAEKLVVDKVERPSPN